MSDLITQAQSYIRSYDKQAEQDLEENFKVNSVTWYHCWKCDKQYEIYWCSQCGSLELEEMSDRPEYSPKQKDLI